MNDFTCGTLHWKCNIPPIVSSISLLYTNDSVNIYRLNSFPWHVPTCIWENENDGMYCFPLYFLKQGISLNPEVIVYTCLPASSRDLSAIPQHWVLQIYMGAGDMNSSPHAFATSSSLTKLSLEPLKIFFTFYSSIITFLLI